MPWKRRDGPVPPAEGFIWNWFPTCTRRVAPAASITVTSFWIVTGKAAEAMLTLPARSVAFAVIEWTPRPNVDDVIDQLPLPFAVPLPITVAPSSRVTVAFASAVPTKTGVVTLVTLSVFDAPLSEAAVRSGVLGAAGAVVSIVTDNAAEATLTLPARLVAFAVTEWVPWPSVPAVIDQLPLPSAVPLPIAVAPSNRVTVVFASAVPTNTGVVNLVTLSVFDAPLSVVAVKSGVLGLAITSSFRIEPIVLAVAIVAAVAPDSVTVNPSSASTAVSPETLSMIVWGVVSPAAKLTVPLGSMPFAKSAALAGLAPLPVTAQFTLAAAVVSPERVTVKVKDLVPSLPSVWLALVAAIDRLEGSPTTLMATLVVSACNWPMVIVPGTERMKSAPGVSL